MDFNKIINSHAVKIGVIVLGIMIYGLLIFKAGLLVGFRKADFSHELGSNYRDVFTNGPPTLGQRLGDHSATNPNGASGKIIKIDEPFLYVVEPDNEEKVISTDDDTIIRMFRSQIPFSSLATDELVIVVGEPAGQGVISAKLIRVMPPSPMR